ncbi:hypothetical protein [Desulfococcus sp.]|uniref:hypothetical protein n=1 Tax=Desulfococcus sp. TaxID=2025834 RepID=UPI003593EAB7
MIHSSLPIDVPNDAIERVLISLHGTGGSADLYLSNGLTLCRKTSHHRNTEAPAGYPKRCGGRVTILPDR